jgi:hypothetical protein
MRKKCWHNMRENNRNENVILKLMIKMLRETKWLHIQGDEDMYMRISK